MRNDFKTMALTLAALGSLGTVQAQGGAGWRLDPDGRRSLILPDPAGASQLVVPPVCWQRACPLVIVSHGRGGQASDGSTHQPFDAMLDAIDVQGFVLLLSSDGGRETWGSPRALNTLRRAYHAALSHFQHDGRVYTLGISMGGLPATLTAYRRTLGIPVNAVALVAGRVNLNNAVDFKAAAEATRLKMQRHSGKGQAPGRDHRTTRAKGVQERA